MNSLPLTPQVKHTAHMKAFLVCMSLISVLYAPVVFGGKSLQPALYQPHGVMHGWPFQYEGRRPVNTFNVDLATPAYYEWPCNKLIGDIYKAGNLPLWNPYQAAGTPLAADYSTRAFFPYQILEDVSPVWTWDYFMLGRLLVAGFFSYLFLARVGLSFSAALLGGVFYMFSGTMVWFINLEQLTNGAMMLPVLLYSLEMMARTGARTQIGISGVVFAMILLAGQPEVALYVLLVGACYFLFRTLSLHGKGRIFSLHMRLGMALGLGIALAAPLLLPFLDLVFSGYHVHRPGLGIGAENVPNWKRVFVAVTPTATEIPADPELLPDVLASFEDPDHGPVYFRAFATKGVWDWMGGYTGVLSVFLALTGIFIVSTKRATQWRGLLLFFFSLGVVLLLKQFGVAPFVWLGYVPVFEMAWGPRWAGPSWVFAFSMAGAIGYQVILACKNRVDGNVHVRRKAPAEAASLAREDVLEKNQRPLSDMLSSEVSGHEPSIGAHLHFLPVAAFFLLAGIYLFVPLPEVVILALRRNLDFSPLSAPYVVPSILIAHVQTIVVLTAALAITLFYMKTGKGIYGLIGLAVLELWWAIPRGYDHHWLYLKTLPFMAGLVVVFALCKHRWLWTTGATALFFMCFLWLDLKAPSGFPDRYDPLTEPPYVRFLKEKQGHFRVMGGYGILYPNYAGAVGLQDVRHINALMIDDYRQYRLQHLQVMLDNEEVDVSSLWFTGRPERVIAVFNNTVGRYFKFVERGIEKDIREKLPGYSLLGVRYFLMPAEVDLNETRLPDGSEAAPYLPVIYDKEIKIYENPHAIPRCFIVDDFRKDAAGNMQIDSPVYGPWFDHPSVDGNLADQRRSKSYASIKEYQCNRVVVEASLDSPGLLVLSDVYDAGWEVDVDHEPADLYRVNGLLRGVNLERGNHTVEFRYLPKAFRHGVVVGAGGVIVVVALLLPRRQRDRTGASQ